SVDLDGVVGLGSPQVGFHVQANHRVAFAVAGAVLDDAAHVPGVDGEKLAGHGHRGELRLDVVADAIERPPQRVGNHRNRFGQADVTHRSVIDFSHELLGGQPGPDLLLKRQAADARILDAIDDDAVDTLAHG